MCNIRDIIVWVMTDASLIVNNYALLQSRDIYTGSQWKMKREHVIFIPDDVGPVSIT